MIPAITLAVNVATIIILQLGGRFVILGSMTLGGFTAFNSYLALLIFPIILLGFMSTVMAQAAHTQQLDPDRISFTGAIQVLGQAIIQSALACPQQVERTLKRLCADLTTKGALVAPRRLRFNCRVVKHICTRFRRKRPEHHNLTLKHMSFPDILRI